jgi:hypothetical protein
LACRHGSGVGPGCGVATGVGVDGWKESPRVSPVTSFAPLQLDAATTIPRANERHPTNLFMTDSFRRRRSALRTGLLV